MSISYDDNHYTTGTSINDFRNNGHKNSWLFRELSNKLLNRIWSEYRDCINSAYVQYKDIFKANIKRQTWEDNKKRCPRKHNKLISVFCRGVRLPSPNECPGFDTKQSDGKVPVMLEFGGMRSTPSLPSLPGSIWPGVVASDMALSMGQIELNFVLMLIWIVWDGTVFDIETVIKLNGIVWNRTVLTLVVCKQNIYLY